MIDSEDLHVPVWVSVRTNFRRPKHNIATGVGVDCIAITTDIVRSVVHGKLLRRKYGVVDDSNRVPFFVSKETGIIIIKAFSKKPAEEVDSEFGDEILEGGSERQCREGVTCLPSQQGLVPSKKKPAGLGCYGNSSSCGETLVNHLHCHPWTCDHHLVERLPGKDHRVLMH